MYSVIAPKGISAWIRSASMVESVLVLVLASFGLVALGFCVTYTVVSLHEDIKKEN